MAGTLIKYTFKVPIPCPPLALLHSLHVMPVTVVPAELQPTVSMVGRTWGVDPGPQDRTAGSAPVVVVVARVELVVGASVVVVVAPFIFVGEDLEPTLRPMASPAPSAARIKTAIPSRRTVLRRTVMNRGSLFATNTNGSSGRSRSGECRVGPAGGEPATPCRLSLHIGRTRWP